MLKKYGVILGLVLLGCNKQTPEIKTSKKHQNDDFIINPKANLIDELKLKGMEFTIPDTDSVKIVLTSISPFDTILSFSYLHDRKMVLNHNRILPLEENYFVIPFQIKTQDSNLLNYLGLFKTNAQNNGSVHLDSYFIKDSIDKLDLASMGNRLVVNYASHGKGKDTPNVKTTLILEVENDQLIQNKE